MEGLTLLKALIFPFMMSAAVASQTYRVPVPQAVLNKKQQAWAGEMKQQQKQMDQLRGEMDSLEKTLGNRNQNYLQVLDKLKKFQDRISERERRLTRQKNEMQQGLKILSNYRGAFVINQIDPEYKAENILIERILKKTIEKKNQELKLIIQETQDSLAELKEMNSETKKLAMIEETLHRFLVEKEVEREKKRQVLEQLSVVSSQFKLDIVQKSGQASFLEFNLPLSVLDRDVSIGPKNKGIAFTFHGTKNLVATNDGEVIYKGNLANYGNVLMIEHAHELKSVILGDFETTLSKGQKVSRGSPIGQTSMPVNFKSGQIYFEMRERQVPMQLTKFLSLDDGNTKLKTHLIANKKQVAL